MTKVYCVLEQDGEYSGAIYSVNEVYIDEKQAQARVEELTAAYRAKNASNAHRSRHPDIYWSIEEAELK